MNLSHAPFRVGDLVRGTSHVDPEHRQWEKPERFEGTVVQVGSGFAGVDRDRAYLWVRLADGTERKCLVADAETVDRTGTEQGVS